jgi:alpha/beta superfamily hydrolase
MAKKTQYKRHSFSSDHLGAAVVTIPNSHQSTGTSPSSISGNVVETATTDQFAYVRVDLRRVLRLGGGFIIGLLVLWVLFEHTGLGNAVYSRVTF